MLSFFNRNNFYEILNGFSTTQLEEMTKQYPFQHELHLLLAKKYQLEKNPAFDEQLQLAAIYAQDRELFFSLFTEAIPEIAVVKNELYGNFEPEEEKQVAEELASVDSPVVSETVVEQEQVEVSVQAEEIIIEPEVVAAAEQNQEEVTEETSEHTFDEWLKLYKPKAVVEETLKQEEQPIELAPTDEDLNRLILENTPVDFLHELVKEETHYSKGLDVFIEIQKSRKKQPEIKKPVQENEIDPDMVTETLAKLYEMQKKYTRAIRAYEALSLKYPEKSDLFAARINYLKNIV